MRSEADHSIAGVLRGKINLRSAPGALLFAAQFHPDIGTADFSAQRHSGDTGCADVRSGSGICDLVAPNPGRQLETRSSSPGRPYASTERALFHRSSSDLSRHVSDMGGDVSRSRRGQGIGMLLARRKTLEEDDGRREYSPRDLPERLSGL